MSRRIFTSTLAILMLLCGLLIISLRTIIPKDLWRTQEQASNTVPEGSPSTKAQQNKQVTSQTPLPEQKSDFQAKGTLRPAYEVNRLCSNRGEQKFVTQDGQTHTFRKSAESIQRCDDGKIWKVTEDGAKTPDPATFYFDGTGVMLERLSGAFLEVRMYKIRTYFM